MSWDVLLLAVPQEYVTMDDIPQDFAGSPLGTAEVVLSQLQKRLPDVDLSDPMWGTLTGPDWSIELNIGPDDPIDSIMLHVRGTGEVLAMILAIADAVGGRALDMSEGVFLTEPGQDRGWRGFQTFRDRVIGWATP